MKNVYKALIALGILAYIFYPTGYDDFLGYAVAIAFVIVLIASVINGTLVQGVKDALKWLKE